MSAGCFKWCLKGFWRVPRVPGGRLEGFWRVSKWCLEVGWRVSAGYLEGVWKVSDSARYKDCAWRVSKVLDQNSF